MREVVIASSVRTPVGRAFKGTLRATRPDELAAVAIRGALERLPQLDKKEIEDVILGCAMPEGESGLNFARIAALRAGLPDSVPGITINRFCSSGLQAIAMAADRIRSGSAQIIIAGGAESLSMIPMTGNKFAPNPWMVDHLPQSYMGMGLTAEQVQKKYGIRREDADQFAYRSHQNALQAQAAGKFDDELVPVRVPQRKGDPGLVARWALHRLHLRCLWAQRSIHDERGWKPRPSPDNLWRPRVLVAGWATHCLCV